LKRFPNLISLSSPLTARSTTSSISCRSKAGRPQQLGFRCRCSFGIFFFAFCL
jgi:hypothetical protein